MMSDVKDEIDFEFVGVDINNVQSNYYSQGVTVYTNSKNLTVQPDTVSKVHEYCIDWTEDELKWLVDGTEERTVKRSDTWNSTSGHFDYPQTPSRVMLSLWPAGLASNAKGTVDWAGGLIDWHSQYMQEGYYYALVQEVNVDCYDPPDGIKKNGNKSYKYTDEAATNNTVEITNDIVVLGSLMGTGENPGEASKSGSASSAKETKSVNMVPGGNPGAGQQATAVVSSGSSATGSGAATTATSTGGPGFIQGSSVTSLEPGLGKVAGSTMAIVFAILGLLVL
jgi:beta-glucanase (GH16 family)